MPRETIQVDIRTLPPWEAASCILALLAYPDERDKVRRIGFSNALVRFAFIARATEDPVWAQTLQLIRPSLLLQDEKTFLAEIKRGIKLVLRGMLTVEAITRPHIAALRSEKVAKLQSGLAPTVENCILSIMESLGYKGDSSKTVAADLWAPSKPVAHLSLAFMGALRTEKLLKAPRDPIQALLDILFLDDLVVYMVLAEYYRTKLPTIKQFRIKEADTIRVEWR